MIKEINFDMDGTIANLYGCDGWLDDILNERIDAYRDAKPMVNMNSLARVLNRLVHNGWTVKVISWTAKNGTNEYNKAVADTKRKWIKKHLGSVQFAEIVVIPYGTPKENYGNEEGLPLPVVSVSCSLSGLLLACTRQWCLHLPYLSSG